MRSELYGNGAKRFSAKILTYSKSGNEESISSTGRRSSWVPSQIEQISLPRSDISLLLYHGVVNVVRKSRCDNNEILTKTKRKSW